MKKLTIVLALAAAALATAGMRRHPANPLTVASQKISVAPQEFPYPVCPPSCGVAAKP